MILEMPIVFLPESENKKENLAKAIQASKEALKIRTVQRYPFAHAVTQNNLGDAYSNLAKICDKEGNLSKAIQAYEETLEGRTVDKYPVCLCRSRSS